MGAARLRAAWGDAAKPEIARRLARDGGLEGRKWKGVGMDAWKQTMQAMCNAPDDGGEEEQVQRPGWTVTKALILYMQRKKAAAEERAARREANAQQSATVDPAGDGIVVFDTETTQLIEADVAIEDMHVSVACAVWLPHAATAATGITF